MLFKNIIIRSLSDLRNLQSKTNYKFKIEKNNKIIEKYLFEITFFNNAYRLRVYCYDNNKFVKFLPFGGFTFYQSTLFSDILKKSASIIKKSI